MEENGKTKADKRESSGNGEIKEDGDGCARGRKKGLTSPALPLKKSSIDWENCNVAKKGGKTHSLLSGAGLTGHEKAQRNRKDTTYFL